MEINTLETTTNLSNAYASEQTIKCLSEGILKIYKPALIKTKGQLKELTEKQELLIDQLHQENLQICEFQNSPELNDVFSVIKEYQTKLINIKRDMKSLHERSIKLKKRAVRLQQFKEQEKYLKEQQKELRIKKEQDLIAKPSTVQD